MSDTEVIFVAGRNCCGKTQLAYALWGCKRANDGVHYEVAELLAGEVTVVAVAGCSCARLYKNDLGEKFLFVDGAPSGIDHLHPLIEVATKLGVVELWIRGCYYRSLERAPFTQFAYPTPLRRVYFEYVTEGELATERSDGCILDLKADALERRTLLITMLTKRSDKYIKALQSRCAAKIRTQTALQEAKGALESAQNEMNQYLQQLRNVEERLAMFSKTVTTLTENLLPPLLHIDVAKVVEDVLASPKVGEMLPAIQQLAGELLTVNHQLAACNFRVRQCLELVSTIERRLARSRDYATELRDGLRENALLHGGLEQNTGDKCQ